MEFFCKKKFYLGLVLLVIILWGCSDVASEKERAFYPMNSVYIRLYPNDGLLSDSVAQNMARGVYFTVHPSASYSLSFDADENTGRPKLQLFRVYQGRDGSLRVTLMDKSIKTSLDEGRYVYQFSCEENEMALWGATLVKDDDYYTGTTANVRLEGDGAYSDHLSLNLVLVGDVGDRLDGFSVDELSSELLDGFRKYYTSVEIDTLYVSYAHDHPTYGSYYPAGEPWIAGRSDEDYMMEKLGGGWPGKENALDLILVYYIDETSVMGLSNLYAGNLGSGEGSTVSIGAYVKMSNDIEANSLNSIVETAVHEAGHYFGLRHTTLSIQDKAVTNDYSSDEDGLEDTPYCVEFILYDLQNQSSMTWSQRRDFSSGSASPLYKADFNTDIRKCKDLTNLMFPVGMNQTYRGFSKQQLEIIRKNLMIFPH